MLVLNAFAGLPVEENVGGVDAGNVHCRQLAVLVLLLRTDSDISECICHDNLHK